MPQTGLAWTRSSDRGKRDGPELTAVKFRKARDGRRNVRAVIRIPATAAVYQWRRKASCTCRALVTTVAMVPAPAEPIFTLGRPKFGRFSRLKNSKRNCSQNLSFMRNSLSTPESQVTSPGPIRMLRPALPNVKGGGFTKHPTSNQSWMLCLSAGRLPLQIRLGRVKVPVLAVGVARNTENGAPDCAVTC